MKLNKPVVVCFKHLTGAKIKYRKQKCVRSVNANEINLQGCIKARGNHTYQSLIPVYMWSPSNNWIIIL